MNKFGMLLLAALLQIIIINQGNGAKILGFFPYSLKSHHRVYQPILRELATRGHSITYLTPIEMKLPPDNLKHIIIDNYYKDHLKDYNKLPTLLRNSFAMVVGSFGISLGMKVLQNENFQRLIASDKQFDLILSEISLIHETFAPLVHRYNASLIEILPSGNLHWSWYLNGNPYDTSYIVDTSVAYTDRMNIMEKIHNTFNSMLYRFSMQLYFLPKYQQIADQYFRYPGWESRPPLDELIRSASIVLVNCHHALNYPYPQAANFKEIGGINIQDDPEPLSKELKDFMDGAKNGVIYFTLGSHIEVSATLNGDLVYIFTKVFSNLKQRVLWKWETEFSDLPQNIRISKWFPQQKILAHKNMKLFITHGGFLSLTESVYNGVPMIGIPIMGDQFKNIKHMETFGYGIPLQLENITIESLSWAINNTLSDQRFFKNAKERSIIFKDKLQTPLETAIYWTEYVIRHKGAAHLRPAIATMPWYQQAMIDVYLTIAVIILIPLYILYKLTRCFLRPLCRCGYIKKETSKTKQKTQ